MKLLPRKRKADFESGLSSFLINEEILRKRCLRSMDNEIKIAGGITLAMFLVLCLFRSYAAAILTRLRRHRNQDHCSSASLEGLIDVAQEATLEISRIIRLLPFLYLQTDNSSSVNSSDYASISTN